MATEYRMLGGVIKLTSAVTLTISLRLSDGTNVLVLDSGEAAYETIAAGSYRTADYAQILASKLLTWITAAKAAAVSGGLLTSTGSPSVTLTYTPSTSANGSLFSLAIGPIGATFVAAPSGTAAITSNAATNLDNATGAYSPLGLLFDVEGSPSASTTTRVGTVSSGTATWSGRFQCRSLHVFDRSEVDEGNAEEEVGYKAIRLADGTGSVYASGRRVTTRTLRLVDLDEDIAGRPVTVGRFASFGATRDIVNITAPSTATLSGISNLYLDADVPTEGAYLQVGTWLSRIRGVVSSTQITLAEAVPSSVTVTAGSPLVQVSEVHGLWELAVRLGYLVVYGPPLDGSSTLRWTSEEYMLAPESARWGAERRSLDDPLYSYSWQLIRRDVSGLTLAS
jgi:hypothetical protein